MNAPSKQAQQAHAAEKMTQGLPQPLQVSGADAHAGKAGMR